MLKKIPKTISPQLLKTSWKWVTAMKLHKGNYPNPHFGGRNPCRWIIGQTILKPFWNYYRWTPMPNGST